MREQVIHAVNMYIDAVRRNDASAAPLHPDMIAEFPKNTYRGAVSFRQALEPFARMVKKIDVLRLVSTASTASPFSISTPSMALFRSPSTFMS